jgi:hypothetical protein
MRPDPLDLYLQTVGDHLGSLTPEDRREIIRELRSHVLDCVKGDLSHGNISAALQTLGDPAEIARINIRMRETANIGERTPLTAAPPIARLLTLGGEGVLTIIFSLAGYLFAGCWIVTALAKPLWPDRVGLWRLPDPTGDLSLSLGRHTEGIGHDILGWWIIPIGIAVGIVCAALTYRFHSQFIRRLARSHIFGMSPPHETSD